MSVSTAAAPVLAAVLVLALLLAAAVATDLRSRRIPNRLVIAGIASALLLHGTALALDMPPPAGAAWWAPAAGLLAGFAALMPLYLLRATGAGDVKLFAMVGAFIGAPAVPGAALYVLVAGGVLSLAWMLLHGVTAKALSNVRFLFTDLLLRAQTGQGAAFAPLQATAARLPYAVAIACGTAAALARPMAW